MASMRKIENLERSLDFGEVISIGLYQRFGFSRTRRLSGLILKFLWNE
jgi:hypothetical protein